MRMLTVSFWVLLLLLATLSVQADPGDYLEIYPTQLRVSGLHDPISVEEGQSINMFCDWTVEAADVHRQWYAGGKEHRFWVRILVDEAVVGSFEAVLGPRTRIGKSDDSRGFSVSRTSEPASWTAKGPGDHKAVCVVNQPKTISDRWPDNNTTDPVTIRVTSKNAKVKGSPVRAKAPPIGPKPASPPATTMQSARAVSRAPRSGRQPTVPLASKQQPPVPVPSVLVVEAETMIATAVVSGGQIVRQEMAEYGAGWGGDAQLFWRPPAPAASPPHLLSQFVLADAGTYELVLYYTAAPDFGQFTVFVDGRESTRIDSYAPNVVLSRSLLGRYELAAGPHELAFEVTGGHQQSTGYIVGIDRLQLTGAGK